MNTLQINKNSNAKLNGNKITFILCRAGVKCKLIDLKNNREIFDKLTKKFSLSVKSITGFYTKIKTYHRDKSYIVFPRFEMLDYIRNKMTNIYIKNKIQPGVVPSTPFVWTGKYNNNQAIIEKHILETYYNAESIKKGNSGLILNLEAGQGKTYLSVGLLQKLQKKTLIVCPNRTIMHQWIKVLNDGYPKNIISSYYGECKEYGDVVVGVINSLIMDTMYIFDNKVTVKEFFEPFGFVIFDEIHEFSGKVRSIIYNRCQSMYMLGLSATPDEKDNHMDNVNTWNCGKILIADHIPNYIKDDVKFEGNITKISYMGHHDYTRPIINDKTGMICHSAMINKICDDPYRIHIIVKAIFELRGQNKFIFVFADRRNYLTRIREELDLFEFKYQELLTESDELKVKQLMGGGTVNDMEHAKQHCNVILTTYQYMGTGCSIPKMDALILATPKKKKGKQYVNRIFRLGSDYGSVREIVDIVDMHTHMKSQWYKRKKYYDEKKYAIKDTVVTWSDIELEMCEMGILEDDDTQTNTELTKTLSELEDLLVKFRLNV